MPAKTNPPERRQKKQPQVGIFWLVGGKLVIDSVPLSEAEPYGDHLTYPRSHLEVWTLFQKKGTAPKELEYEDPPRGRVVWNTKTRRFIVLADRCILTDRNILTRIM